ANAMERAATLADTIHLGRAAAQRSIELAALKLGEREAVFSAAQLERSAGEFGFGRATLADIVAASRAAVKSGDLVARTAMVGSRQTAGFTTRAAVEAERRMLETEYRGRGSVEPSCNRIEASRIVAHAEIAACDRGHAWND